MQCELCGKEIDRAVLVSIEGVEMETCNECARHGKRIIKPKVEKVQVARIRRSAPVRSEEIEEVVSDYSHKIKKAMESMDMKIEHMAKRLGLKESELRHYEQGRMKPKISDAKKLERFFGIKIIDKVTVKKIEELQDDNSQSKSLTIGDMIRVRKKKQQ